ncbi:hypothetical protein DICPUDRAFT_54525 [Dictyostelium purpureum]|uniref:NAD-dependent epimerase/dehydratase domain-containing protein n=1 Tax=Dictyostelium purpureum TaxID=5786 RepID=F0ZHF3_DICPU|nr:uncharacterized protein DICPUDRAFT_54525 [Dictyostelium purpureum]EGC36620.1 hypothetical protein DICPUDRAFT_54525 [Dictyostelium purpureum]|eukprot:XP_003286858.1 hypothetical protein DICPUDRAFT_54525 [Dictyostelium purpureum]
MKTVFVTGATGFLGCNLVEQLLSDKENDYLVYALYRSSKKVGELKSIAKILNKQDNLKLVKGDISNYESLLNAIPDNCTFLFHLAAAIDSDSPEKQYEINVNGTANVIEACISRKVQRLIYTSSIATFDFDDVFSINELTSKKNFPRLEYARTKRIAELYVDEAMRRGLDVVVVSPGFIIGRYDEFGVGSIILMIANESSSSIRCGQAKATFCSAEDCARAHIKAAEVAKPGTEFVIGGNAYYWKELYEQVLFQLNIEKHVQVTSPLSLVLIGKKNDLFKNWFGSKNTMIKPISSEAIDPTSPNSILSASSTKASKSNPSPAPYLTMVLAIFQSIDLNIDSTRAIEKLNYKYSTLEFMINDNIKWLKKRNLL